jgi:hypothetical protein
MVRLRISSIDRSQLRSGAVALKWWLMASPIVFSEALPRREYALKMQQVAVNQFLTSKAGISLYDPPAKV